MLSAKLPPEVGATVIKALEAAVEALDQQDEAEQMEAPDVSAETPVPEVVEMDRDVSTETPVPEDDDADWEVAADWDVPAGTFSPPPPSPPKLPGAWPHEARDQRQADALGLLVRSALDAGLDVGRDAARYQVMLHVDAEVLADPHQEGRCHLDHEVGVSAQTARRLSCDGSTVVLREGEDGQAIDVGRRSRRVSAALHRALLARDQTCRFPGCDHSRYLQAHHVQHWAAGGPTDLGNLINLCGAHHRCLHERGFSVEADPDGGFSFHYPDGRLLAQSPALPPLPDDPVVALTERNREAGLLITAKTAAPRWEGDNLDYDWVLMWMPPPN